MKFHHFWLLQKKSFWLPLEKSIIAPLEKILPTPMCVAKFSCNESNKRFVVTGIATAFSGMKLSRNLTSILIYV